MKVFISWSGDLSKSIAEAFRQWIPGVIQAVKPYYTPDDITKGSRWSGEIAKELDSSKVGIICLTRDNLHSPWIMFEAGALSKNIDKSKVCPLLFDIEASDIQGPLVQFQAAKFAKEEIRKVIKMINTELGETGLAGDVLDDVFDMWWPKLKDSIDKILAEKIKEKKKDLRTERDILEEILDLTRATSITRDRLQRKVSIPKGAVEDLVYAFTQLTESLEVYTGHLQVLSIIDAIRKFHRPLRFLIDEADIANSMRLELEEKYLFAETKLSQIAARTSRENNIEDKQIDENETQPKIRTKSTLSLDKIIAKKLG